MARGLFVHLLEDFLKSGRLSGLTWRVFDKWSLETLYVETLGVCHDKKSKKILIRRRHFSANVPRDTSSAHHTDTLRLKQSEDTTSNDQCVVWCGMLWQIVLELLLCMCPCLFWCCS